MKEKRKEEKRAKEGKRERARKRFVSPEIVEEKDFRGVVAVRAIQSLSNILPKTFRV